MHKEDLFTLENASEKSASFHLWNMAKMPVNNAEMPANVFITLTVGYYITFMSGSINALLKYPELV